MAGGILPVARYKGQLFFLFGREVGDGKWSDFGGRREGDETPWETAIREGSEELNGFFGNTKDLGVLVNNNAVYRVHINSYDTYIFQIDYDANLPNYFVNNHRFIKKHLPKEVRKGNGLFEKSEIAWFSLTELRRSRHFFRNFYRKTIDTIRANSSVISSNMR